MRRYARALLDKPAVAPGAQHVHLFESRLVSRPRTCGHGGTITGRDASQTGRRNALYPDSACVIALRQARKACPTRWNCYTSIDVLPHIFQNSDYRTIVVTLHRDSVGQDPSGPHVVHDAQAKRGLSVTSNACPISSRSSAPQIVHARGARSTCKKILANSLPHVRHRYRMMGMGLSSWAAVSGHRPWAISWLSPGRALVLQRPPLLRGPR
jgi:hypothetical protein